MYTGPALSLSYALDMRILIAGDRFWDRKDVAEAVVKRLIARYGADLVVVHGGAAGFDTSFHLAAKS
jgi:hypothetical protein